MTLRVRLDGHALAGPVADVLRLFARRPGAVRTASDGREVIGMSEQEDSESSEFCSEIRRDGDGWTVRTTDASAGRSRSERFAGSSAQESPPVAVRRAVKRQLFILLSDRTGIRPPWGSLTGIRPTLLAEEALAKGLDARAAAEELADLYGVRPEKAALAVRVALAEAEALDRVPEDRPFVYVSVPFCTTRCAYCSFPSGTVARFGSRMPAYLDALLAEAARAGARLAAEGRVAAGFYVGGGTPAVLSAEAIAGLLRGLRERIPFRPGFEGTFEAGRCDDLDEAKIAAIADGGCGRLCLNPQSTDPGTLARIGRPDAGPLLARWTAAARRAGIGTVSMDLIAGLPSDAEDGFHRSLGDVLALRPENVTVHALSRKRGADLAAAHEAPDPYDGTAGRMADAAARRLAEAGYAPCHLYRQKDAAGGLENVGWTLPGSACLYNVAMMSDRRPVIGLGAGATSKELLPGRRGVVRTYGPTDPEAYLARIARGGADG